MSRSSLQLLGTLRKLDGNATTAAKTIWLKQVIVKKVCLVLSIVRSQYSLRLRSHGTGRIRDRTQIRPVTAVHTKPDKLRAKKCSHGAGRILVCEPRRNFLVSCYFSERETRKLRLGSQTRRIRARNYFSL